MKHLQNRSFWRWAFCLAGAMLALPCVTLMAQPVPGGMGFVEKPREPAKVGFEAAPDESLEYVVDAGSKRNEVVFVSRAPKETIKGQTKKLSGHLSLNPHSIGEVKGVFEVDWYDLSTGKPMMDEHMRDEPWVNAKSHPKIVFNVTGFEAAEKQPEGGKVLKGKLIGTFAMNGRENPVQIPVTLAYVPAGEGKKGKKVKEALGIKAAFSVALADYGIEGKVMGDKKTVGTAVAEKQKITVSVFLARGAEAPAKDTTKKASGKSKSKKKSNPA